MQQTENFKFKKNIWFKEHLMENKKIKQTYHNFWVNFTVQDFKLIFRIMK